MRFVIRSGCVNGLDGAGWTSPPRPSGQPCYCLTVTVTALDMDQRKSGRFDLNTAVSLWKPTGNAAMAALVTTSVTGSDVDRRHAVVSGMNCAVSTCVPGLNLLTTLTA